MCGSPEEESVLHDLMSGSREPHTGSFTPNIMARQSVAVRQWHGVSCCNRGLFTTLSRKPLGAHRNPAHPWAITSETCSREAAPVYPTPPAAVAQPSANLATLAEILDEHR